MQYFLDTAEAIGEGYGFGLFSPHHLIWLVISCADRRCGGNGVCSRLAFGPKARKRFAESLKNSHAICIHSHIAWLFFSKN